MDDAIEDLRHALQLPAEYSAERVVTIAAIMIRDCQRREQPPADSGGWRELDCHSSRARS